MSSPAPARAVPPVHLIEPALDRVSGGARYNRSVCVADTSGRLIRHALPGPWPHPAPADDARVRDLLRTLDGPVVLDGLLGCGLPRPVEHEHPVLQLVHLPLGHQDGHARERERENLRAADGILVPSATTAAELADLYGVPAQIAPPGTDPRPLTERSDHGGRLLCLASVEPRKNQLLLVRALAGALDHLGGRDDVVRASHPRQVALAAADDVPPPVHCTIAGPVADPAYVEDLERAVAELPAGAVSMPGELDPEDVARHLAETDLLVLPSTYESYGLVVAEAAAAGIPALVVEGSGAEEALRAGRAVPGDVESWTHALHTWLTDGSFRDALRRNAEEVRGALAGWDTTAEIILRVVDGTPVAGGGRAADGQEEPIGTPPHGPSTHGKDAPRSPEHADWLDLRRPHDDRARHSSLPLVERAADAARQLRRRRAGGTEPDRALRVCDVGAGTGRSALWFDTALRPVTGVRWLLLDDDADALAVASTRLPGAETVCARMDRLPEILGAASASESVDLVVGSAVLDVLRERDVAVLVDTLRRARVPGLFLLTVNGRWRVEPGHPADDLVKEAFAAHQRRDSRVGAGAVGRVRYHAERAGLAVVTGPSDWHVRRAEAPAFTERFLRDRVAAATEHSPQHAARFATWLADRLADPELAVTVEHRDVLVLPPGSAP